MNDLRWLLGFLTPYRWRMVLAAVLGYLAIAANVGLMGTSGYLIAAAALHPATILLLWTPIVGVRFFGISRSVFRYLERLVSHDLTFRILATVRVWYYRQLERSRAVLLENMRSADLLAAAVSDVESLQNLYLRVVAPPLVALLVGVMSVFLVARYSLAAAALFGLAYIITGCLIPALSFLLGKTAGEEQVRLRSRFQTTLGDTLAGMTELMLAGQQDVALARLEQEQEALSDALRRRQSVESTASGVFVWMTNLAVWITLVTLIPAVSSHAVAGVELPSLLFIVLASFEAVLPLPSAVQALSETAAAARRVRSVGGNPSASAESVESVESVESLPAKTKIPLLECTALTVRYPNRTRNALRDVELTLRPGEVIAVVGESGSGKSTLIHALLRLCQYEGSIRVNGKDTSGLSDEEMRSLFAVVTQKDYLFHVSVADNLRLARPGAPTQELEGVVKVAQISELIARLPEGLDTLVGEDGTRFSGGERQRMALARAILRDAPIFLLDEPTSGLDTETEARFLDALWRAKGDCSVIYVTHRLSGLENADRICVMHEGVIVEQGTFAELVGQANSRFQRLWQMETWKF